MFVDWSQNIYLLSAALPTKKSPSDLRRAPRPLGVAPLTAGRLPASPTWTVLAITESASRVSVSNVVKEAISATKVVNLALPPTISSAVIVFAAIASAVIVPVTIKFPSTTASVFTWNSTIVEVLPWVNVPLDVNKSEAPKSIV